ncbi:MAG: ATP-binding cassette domain-containing protein [Gemmatimonas sp.]|nr:ATP-binding cassette domain-containing protein [Gemmatimonas sp.]
MSDERVEEGAAIAAIGVHKTYVGGDGSLLEVLAGADLVVQPGETVAIIGESGSGKSTLLHLLGGLDRPTKGSVWIGGTRLANLDEDATSRIRNQSIGFVFQFHHLLREFTVLENVMIPTLITGRTAAQARDRARKLLCDVGLEGRLEHKPSQLSGGEQQRVAVARALVNEPLALLADEPSGNLDPGTSDRLHQLLFTVNESYGTAMVLVTHNMHLAERSGRVLEVRGGQLVPTTLEATEYPKRSVG